MQEFMEANTIVPLITPVDFQTGANNGDWVNFAGYERAVIVLYGGVGTAAQDPIFKLQQAKDVAGTSPKDILFTRYRTKIGASLAAISDFTLSTQAAATSVTPTSAASEKMIVVEIKASDLDVQNGYQTLQLSVADVGGNAQLACAFAIMVGGRYYASTPPSPII